MLSGQLGYCAGRIVMNVMLKDKLWLLCTSYCVSLGLPNIRASEVIMKLSTIKLISIVDPYQYAKLNLLQLYPQQGNASLHAVMKGV